MLYFLPTYSLVIVFIAKSWIMYSSFSIHHKIPIGMVRICYFSPIAGGIMSVTGWLLKQKADERSVFGS